MQKLKELFSMKGRMNRKRFILDSIMYSIAPKVWSIVLFAETARWAKMEWLIFPLMAVVIGSTLIQFCLACRRLHDLNSSGWGVLVLLIPGANLLFLFFLCGMRGSIGFNQYGPDPLEGLEFMNMVK